MAVQFLCLTSSPFSQHTYIYIFSFYFKKHIKININRNIISLFIYGRKTCCLMLSEEHILKVSENRVLREIFVAERNWETVDCRKLHSGELHDQCCWLNVTGWLNGKGEMCGGIWEVLGERGAYRIIWGDLSDRRRLEELGKDKMKLFELIFKK